MTKSLIDSPHIDMLLASHQFQGGSNDCGPYSIAIICNALKGTTLDGHKLGQEMNGFGWSGIRPIIRRIPNWATTPGGVVVTLREFGLKARLRLFSTPENLLENLRRGRISMPIIGEWKPLWAHYMSLTAYHPKTGWGFTNSAHSKGELYWLNHADFEKQWNWSLRMVIEAELPETQNA